jgi:hypothetical protein
MAFVTRTPPVSSRSATNTFAPAAASACAVASPIPEPAPVTNAVLPSRRNMRLLYDLGQGACVNNPPSTMMV